MRIPRTMMLVRRAMRRLVLADLLRVSGVSLVVGAGVALGLVGVNKLLGDMVDWRLVVSGPIVVSVVGAIGVVVARRRGSVGAAAELDRTLELKDRFSSAVELGLAETSNDEVFVHLALHEAESAADGVDVKRAFPLVLGNSWVIWPVVGAGAIVVSLFVPAMHLNDQAEARAKAEVERLEVAEQVAQAIEQAEDVVEPDSQDDATRDELEVLEDLHRELTQGRGDPDELRAKAADAIDEMADAIDEQARLEQLESDALAESLSAAAAGNEDAQSDIVKALGEGDLEAARQAAQELMNQGPEMSAQEREQIARELEDLSRFLDEQAAESREAIDDERLAEQGLSRDQIERLREQTDVEEISEQLQEEGMDRDAADRLAQEVAKENEQQQAEEEARRDAKELSEALKEAAEEVRSPDERESRDEGDPDEPEGEEPIRQESDDGDDDDAGDEGADKGREPDADGEEQRMREDPEGEEGEPGGDEPGDDGEQEQGDQGDEVGDEPGDEQGKEPGTEPGERPGEEAGEEPGEEPGDEDGQKPGEEPGTEPGEEPGEDSGDQPGERAGDEPGTEPGEEPGEKPGGQPKPGQQEGEGEDGEPGEADGEKPSEGGDEGEGESPASGEEEQSKGAAKGSEESADEGEQQGQPVEGGQASDEEKESKPGGTQGEGSPKGLQRLADRLEEMAEQQQGAQDRMDDAKELRERAQELLENASPEELEQLQRLAQQMQRETAGQEPLSWQKEGFDARQQSDEPGEKERVIAQWYRDGPIEPGQVERAEATDNLKRAADGLQQAIEQQQVPARHRDFLQRVYKRYLQSVADGAVPAKTAEDADSQ